MPGRSKAGHMANGEDWTLAPQGKPNGQSTTSAREARRLATDRFSWSRVSANYLSYAAMHDRITLGFAADAAETAALTMADTLATERIYAACDGIR